MTHEQLEMNLILKLNTLWRSHYVPQQSALLLLLLFSFLVCLTATTNVILNYANNAYTKYMVLSFFHDNKSTQGLVNIESIYADAINTDRQASVDVTQVKEQLQYEQKLADLDFVLEQYQMMELQAFKFAVMLTHLQQMLAEFTALNPDISASWQVDPINTFKLIVQLNTERQRHWGGARFII
jgi:hypothetical protein